MTQSDFIGLVNGKPRANRACSFEQMDCWGWWFCITGMCSDWNCTI